jgi:hypothetical protein
MWRANCNDFRSSTGNLPSLPLHPYVGSSCWLSLNIIAARNVPFSSSDLSLGDFLVLLTSSITTNPSPGRIFHLPLCILTTPPLPQLKPASKRGGIISLSIKRPRKKANRETQVCHGRWLFRFFLPSTCVLPDSVVHTVFGKPLGESLRYASVQISTANTNGKLYVWGYIPVVVAKWYVTLSISPPDIER